jgi:hypothetical protein
MGVVFILYAALHGIIDVLFGWFLGVHYPPKTPEVKRFYVLVGVIWLIRFALFAWVISLSYTWEVQ